MIERDGLVLRDLVVFDRSGEFVKADYPWMVEVDVHAKGGDAGSGGASGRPGYVVLELWGFPEDSAQDVVWRTRPRPPSGVPA